MAGSSSKSKPPKSSYPKPKPSEVAAETKRAYLPLIKNTYAEYWPTHSILVPSPLTQLAFADRPANIEPPQFWVRQGDPVDIAISWPSGTAGAPLICVANDKRAGGDWETGVQGYEERLCRRSSLAATLGTPAPGSGMETNFPIPSTGAIWSESVVVFRGPNYEPLDVDSWRSLPICSVPPTRWPKLSPDGTKYSFSDERAMVKDKVRGALRIVAYNGHERVVVAGDWGLGNAHRNPPRELAEVWREVLLYDPELRGRIREVAFVFEDEGCCTEGMIWSEMAKKREGKSGGKGKGKSAAGGGGSGSGSGGMGAGGKPDALIFSEVFDEEEVKRVLAQPDKRYGLDNLLTK